jgi:hypothetical protein
LAKPSDTDRPRSQQQHREIYTAYDRALVKAAQEELPVTFSLLNGGVVRGTVKSVDKYAIEIEEPPAPFNPVFIWVMKAAIASTKIGEK